MRQATKALSILIFFLFVFSSLFSLRNPYTVKTTLAYATRPVWDTSYHPPSAPIINFASPSLFASHTNSPAYICNLHNQSTPRDAPVELWDAIIFGYELEMLEIHFEEVDSVVDRFVILESNVSYSGGPKRLYFEENKHRFEKWAHKISHHVFTGTQGSADSFVRDPFALEIQQRVAMSNFLNSLGIPDGTLVISADVDEIPYKDTLKLIKMCKLPAPLHLMMKDFLYSFEFVRDTHGTWKTLVQEWDQGTSYYKHTKASENYMADAGVHCSFCFRSIEEFQFKMQAYAHADRLGDHPELLLRPDWIQKAICEGANIFNMLPEAYTFRDLVWHWKGTSARMLSSNGALDAVKADPGRFSYLLPGGCRRPLTSRDSYL